MFAVVGRITFDLMVVDGAVMEGDAVVTVGAATRTVAFPFPTVVVLVVVSNAASFVTTVVVASAVVVPPCFNVARLAAASAFLAAFFCAPFEFGSDSYSIRQSESYH